MFSEPAREHRLHANGIEHHVLEWGSGGETVVLCHGFLDMAFGFAALAPRLHGRRVIAVDFRGHGETDWVPPGGYYHFPDYLLDLHTLLPQLVREPFHLVGHSMGGAVAVMYAATHPLRSLALLEGIGISQEDASHAPRRLADWLAQASVPRRFAKLRDLEEALSRMRARHPTVDVEFLRALAQRSTCPHPSGEGLSWRFDPLHRTSAPTAFDTARFFHLLAQIAAPTLVVSGECGRLNSDHSDRVAALKDAREHVVPNAGHMLHWTHAEEVATLLNQHFA